MADFDLDAALGTVVAALPNGAPRQGQHDMADAVWSALTERRHLFVQAGTGTGKSVAYLVPAIGRRRRVVVATATKALQEQLVDKDLPFLARSMSVPFEYALLKGRSNYVCRALLPETGGDEQGELDGVDGQRAAERAELAGILDWVDDTESGDRAHLPFTVTDAVWDRVSLDSRECPGKTKCDQGETCFAELARVRARAADVVVVNAALYAQHLASGGYVLPEHDAVVIDEAHMLEDVCADAFAVSISAFRLSRVDGLIRSLFTNDLPTEHAARRLSEWPNRIEVLLAGCPLDEELDLDNANLRTPLAALDQALADVGTAVRAATTTADDTRHRVARSERFLTGLRTDVQALLAATPQSHAIWVEGRRARVLCAAPTDVGPLLSERLFANTTTVLTSATLAVAGDFSQSAWRLGLRTDLVPDASTAADDGEPDASVQSEPEVSVGPDSDFGDDEDWDPDSSEADGRDEPQRPVAPMEFDAVDVGSPFDYRKQSILYVAAHLPDPRHDSYESEAFDEAVALVEAAGGRTLGLCTSLRAAESLRERLRVAVPGVSVLAPDDMPRPKLMEAFAADETSCLIGSLGLWQGIDIPGPSVSLVLIDKIPFARPTEPLAVARRARAVAEGKDGFRAFDLPRAAMLLAQGAGRLVRTVEDRGVVAVLDRRLVTSGYGKTLLASMPPMFTMTNGDRVRAALRRLTGTDPAVASESSP